MSVYGLTSADVEFIRRLRRDLDALPVISSRSDQFEELGQTPDVHVVRAPEGGVPSIAAFAVETGTGSWVGGDTGTGYDEAFLPSSAECEVYRLEDINGTMELVAQGFELTVYNLMPVGVDEGVFVIATRDKYGDWYIPNPGLPFTTC